MKTNQDMQKRLRALNGPENAKRVHANKCSWKTSICCSEERPLQIQIQHKRTLLFIINACNENLPFRENVHVAFAVIF